MLPLLTCHLYWMQNVVYLPTNCFSGAVTIKEIDRLQPDGFKVRLDVLPVDHHCVSFVQVLLQIEYAYVASGSAYFFIFVFSQPSRISRLNSTRIFRYRARGTKKKKIIRDSQWTRITYWTAFLTRHISLGRDRHFTKSLYNAIQYPRQCV